MSLGQQWFILNYKVLINAIALAPIEAVSFYVRLSGIKDIADSGKQLLIMTRNVLICHECQILKMSCCQIVFVVPT
ncbi:hypothetical protein B0A79_16160 [Flavobacterium piscis]|uniref:Uncharacterized protein n=1 Tax=Flavobacterium piscis TaxID=1114874 RepID=A0ABX2XUB8_9FLAO|nr:hypothetical protein FLP_00235 [Flavobacterium piscis]OXG02217.1 hypothetical protein B0A79_16160 [Flavobacterium piscis]